MPRRTVRAAVLVLLLAAVAPSAHAAGIDEAKTGLALANLGLTGEALDRFRIALADPALPSDAREKTLYNMGTLQLALHDPDRAIASFDEALRLTPRRARTLINRADAFSRLGRPEAALKDLDAAVAAAPGMADARYARGLALLTLGRTDDAAAAFAEAIKIRRDPRYLTGSGIADLLRGRIDRARESFAEAAGRNLAEAGAWLAAAEARKGNPDAARAAMARAIALAPDDQYLHALARLAGRVRWGRMPLAARVTREVEACAYPIAAGKVRARLAAGSVLLLPACERPGWCTAGFGGFSAFVPRDALEPVAP